MPLRPIFADEVAAPASGVAQPSESASAQEQSSVVVTPIGNTENKSDQDAVSPVTDVADNTDAKTVIPSEDKDLIKPRDSKDPSSETQSLTQQDLTNGAPQPTLSKQIIPEPDQTNGALTAHYPIVIPPGRNKMQPDVRLDYNSQTINPDSSVGYGWTVSVPFISRLNKNGINTMYSDGYFTSSLSGELTLVSGTTYAAKTETGEFLKYTFSGSVWTVTNTQGTVYTFGSSASTRQDDPADSTKIFKWMLEEVRDTNNNYISYTYYKNAGQIYPSTITYTGNGSTAGIFEVDFLRQSRPDVVKSYASGFLATSNYRLNQIDVKTNSTVTRTYSLAYTTGDNSGRSLLNTITEAGTDEITSTTVTLPSTTYTNATTTTAGWSANSSWSLPSNTSFDGRSLFADINGDGLPDILTSYNDPNNNPVREAYLNNGGGTWTLSTAYAPPAPFMSYSGGTVSYNYYAQDLNGDGLSDLFNSIAECNGLVCSTTSSIYLNNGSGWTTSSNTLPTPLSWQGNAISVVSDLNSDGLPDLFTASLNLNGVYPVGGVYLNNGDGTWTTDTSNWTFPYSANDTQTQYLDLNNDGIIDIIHLSYTSGTSLALTAYLGNGKGTYASSSDYSGTIPVPNFGSSVPTDFGVRFADLNADGLVDVIRSLYWGGTTYRATYLNTGVGWSSDVSSWYTPGSFAFTNGFGSQKNILDLTGDGLPDILETNTSIYLSQGNATDLLKTISYPAGGSSSISYKSSAQNGYNGLNPGLPFVLQTVDQITTSDGLGLTGTNTFSNSGGFYYTSNLRDRRFAGFGQIKKTDPVGNYTISYFHQGNGSDSTHGEYSDEFSKIGKVYRIEAKDASNNIYSKTITKWDKYTLGTGRDFVKLAQQVALTYDGDSSHKDTAESYTYDNTYGTVTQKVEWGQVTGSDDGTFTDTGSDKFTTDYTYAVNTTPYIVGLLKQQTVTDQSAARVKEDKYYYDSQTFGNVTKGNETKHERWKASSTYVNTQKTYNSTYGYVASETNERGKTTSYSYDTYNLYPATVTDPLTHATSYTYDYSSGKVKQTTDQNSLIFQTIYDGLDRALEEKQPDQTTPATLVTKSTYAYTDTSGSVSLHKVDYLDGSTTVDSYIYYDGLSRPIQTRQEIEGSTTFAVRDTIYNSTGQVYKQSLPYSSTGSTKTSPTATTSLLAVYTYDPVGRVSSVVDAAGTTATAYSDWKITVTDARSKAKDLYKDAYGNLVQVDEHNSGSTYSTYYTYNGNNNLLNITDALGNVRNFTYDGLGRRLTAQDLHASGDSTFGSWTYTYDDAGNLTQSVDPKSQTINYTYDDINRQLTEDYTGQAGTEVTNTYDSGTYGIGHLTGITTGAHSQTNTYSPLGAIRSEAKTIASVGYTTTYDYDRQGNKINITNPDSSQVKYIYNSAGLLEKVQRKELSDSGFTDVVSNFDYSPTGQQTTIAYYNGATTTNTYDATKLYRLTSKVTTIVSSAHAQDLAYTYDAVGNVTQIVDASATDTAKIANYVYDDLNRLTSATITSVASGQSTYTHTYTYDAIGNILTKSDGAGTYSYSGSSGSNYANPHAVTSIGSNTYTYDNNGNLVTSTLGGGVSIAADTTTTNITSGYNGTITKTWSHTTSSGSNRLLVVSADLWQDVAGTGTVTSVTYNGVALTKAGSSLSGGMESELWYLANPATGANTVSVTVTGATDAVKLAASTFTGVDQTSPFVAANTATGSSGNPTVSRTTSVANSLVVATLARYSTTAATSNRTSLYNNATGSVLGATSYQLATTTGSYSDTYTGSASQDWSMAVAEFRPASTSTTTTNTWDYNNRLTQEVTGSLTTTYSYDQAGQRLKYANGTTTSYYPSQFYNTDGTTATKHIFDDKGAMLATVQSTGGTSSIAADATSTNISNAYSGTTTKTWTHTASSGSNRILVLSADLWQDVAGTGAITAASYNGVALTKATNGRTGGMASEIWYLVNPASGANTVSVTVTGATDAIKLAASTFTGVAQASPLDVSTTSAGTSGNPTISATTTAASDVVVSILSRYSTTAASTNRTSLYNNVTGSTLGAASYQLATTAGSYSDTYTGSAAQDWSMTVAAFKPATNSTATVHYIHADHLSGSNIVTNSSNAKDEILDYYPFGSLRFDQKPGSYSEQRKFTGYVLDADTGLNYAGARYYNAVTGKFISQDSAFWDFSQISTQLQDPQSWNSYAYGRNNPLRYNDPDGQFWQEFARGDYDRYNPANILFGADTQRVTNGLISGNYSEVAKGAGNLALTGATVAATALEAANLAADVATAYRTYTRYQAYQTELQRSLESKSVLQQNKAVGSAFEQRALQDLQKSNDSFVGQVTLKTSSGVRTRVDAIGRSSSGTCIVECKSSLTAPLTPNQAKAFPEIEKSGATVVGKGKPGFPGGTFIGPTRVQILRPAN